MIMGTKIARGEHEGFSAYLTPLVFWSAHDWALLDFEGLRQVLGVVLVHLAPKITSVGRHSAQLCQISVCLGSCPVRRIRKYVAWKLMMAIILPNGTSEWLT